MLKDGNCFGDVMEGFFLYLNFLNEIFGREEISFFLHFLKEINFLKYKEKIKTFLIDFFVLLV